MISEEVYEAVKLIDRNDIIKGGMDLCNVIYPEYDDSVIKDIFINELIASSLYYKKVMEELTKDIIQFLNIHGIYLNEMEALDIYTALGWSILELNSNDEDTLTIAKDFITVSDPELSISEVANYFRPDNTIQDYLEVIEHVDPFTMEKIAYTLNDKIAGTTPRLNENIVYRLRELTKIYPDNIAMEYLKNGGVLGGSAETYLKLFKREILDGDAYHDVSNKSLAFNIISAHILAGYPLARSKRESILYINEFLNLSSDNLRDVLRNINNINLVV